MPDHCGASLSEQQTTDFIFCNGTKTMHVAFNRVCQLEKPHRHFTFKSWAESLPCIRIIHAWPLSEATWTTMRYFCCFWSTLPGSLPVFFALSCLHSWFLSQQCCSLAVAPHFCSSSVLSEVHVIMENIFKYAHLKYTVSGWSKQAHMCTEWSPTSMGLTQAHPYHVHPAEWLVIHTTILTSYCMTVDFHFTRLVWVIEPTISNCPTTCLPTNAPTNWLPTIWLNLALLQVQGFRLACEKAGSGHETMALEV